MLHNYVYCLTYDLSRMCCIGLYSVSSMFCQVYESSFCMQFDPCSVTFMLPLLCTLFHPYSVTFLLHHHVYSLTHVLSHFTCVLSSVCSISMYTISSVFCQVCAPSVGIVSPVFCQVCAPSVCIQFHLCSVKCVLHR